jgi:hypothetical protein
VQPQRVNEAGVAQDPEPAVAPRGMRWAAKTRALREQGEGDV